MSGWIEIIIAILIVGIIGRFITYIVGFFAIFPTELNLLLTFAISLSIALFIIHRKD